MVKPYQTGDPEPNPVPLAMIALALTVVAAFIAFSNCDNRDKHIERCECPVCEQQR